MTCTDCKAEGADCLTHDRIRVCETCLYERTAKERDEANAEIVLHKEDRLRLRNENLRLAKETNELRAEVERLRAWKPVGTFSVDWPQEQERLRLIEERNQLRTLVEGWENSCRAEQEHLKRVLAETAEAEKEAYTRGLEAAFVEAINECKNYSAWADKQLQKAKTERGQIEANAWGIAADTIRLTLEQHLPEDKR